MDNDDMESIERFQRMFISPLVDVVQCELRTTREEITRELRTIADQQKKHTEKSDKLDQRLSYVEANMKKALIGWGAVVMAGTIGVALLTHWLRGYI